MSDMYLFRPLVLAAAVAVASTMSACSKAPDIPVAGRAQVDAASEPAAPPVASASSAGTRSAGTHDDGIAWQKQASESDIDAAFARARAENKPLFLYWGAIWCPPCNQVKATIFNRQDFIERSRFFIPVYLDGDTRSAQKLGARFKVGGYPTMILFKPDGSEITRLPGEVDAERYMNMLAMGMNGARPVRETLAAALYETASGRGSKADTAAALSSDDWRMLAWYSWGTDEGMLVPETALPATLARLARACPPDQAEAATRLRLQSLAAAAGEKGAKPQADELAVRDLMRVIDDDTLARTDFDVLTNDAGDIAGHVTLPGTQQRRDLVSAWDARLRRFSDDASLSTADRFGALVGRIELARVGDNKAPLPPDLLERVRKDAAQADRDTTDVYARQAVISAAAYALEKAGLDRESDRLLEAELKRSHSPYYYMLSLAQNAKKRGDKAAALDWAQKAYAAADSGPATRLQWGSSYVGMLIDLAPEDSARIEQAARGVIGELEPEPETFYDRNRRRLERIGRDLAKWNADGRHTAQVRAVRAALDEVCAKLPPDDAARATCKSVLDARPNAKSEA